MPSKPIERSYAGPAMLARIVTAKFAEHTPHYRQSEIYRSQGVELNRATLGRWSGAVSEPLYDLLKQYVLKQWDALNLYCRNGWAGKTGCSPVRMREGGEQRCCTR